VIRFLARVRYFVGSAALGLRSSPVTSTIAVVTIAVTLVLVGAFALLVTNMQGVMDRFGAELVLSAYLEDDLDAAAQELLAERVRGVEGVENVEVIGKDQALERFRASVGGRAALLEGLEDNPLPPALEIVLASGQRSPEGLRRVVESVEGLRGVTDLGYGQEWVEGYANAVALVRGVGFVIGGVLALSALLIVANTIRLAVYARRDELDILLLVGASRSFVSLPFLLEGAVQGALGGGLALGLLYGMYRLLLPGLAEGLAFLLGYADPAFLGSGGALWLVAGGSVLGVLGSAAAVLQGLRS